MCSKSLSVMTAVLIRIAFPITPDINRKHDTAGVFTSPRPWTGRARGIILNTVELCKYLITHPTVASAAISGNDIVAVPNVCRQDVREITIKLLSVIPNNFLSSSNVIGVRRPDQHVSEQTLSNFADILLVRSSCYFTSSSAPEECRLGGVSGK